MHYASKMFEQKHEVVASPPSLLQSLWGAQDPVPATTSVTTIGRKGNLYGMVNVQPLSEEMLISPKLLDFLEQALEPIAVESVRPSQSKMSAMTDATLPEATLHQRLDDTVTSLTGGSSGSMPIDIVVYVCVQPSRVRFTCLPVSRVQCLIKIPSFDFVFSTQKKSDSEGAHHSIPFEYPSMSVCWI